MTIEIHSPHKDTTETLVNSIKKSVLELYHLDKDISRGEIYLLQARGDSNKEKRCDIRLSIYKDAMFVSRRAPNYTEACKEAVKELKKMVKQKIRRKLGRRSAFADPIH
jgi:ribosome-associated translation inhibitor RaiA